MKKNNFFDFEISNFLSFLHLHTTNKHTINNKDCTHDAWNINKETIKILYKQIYKDFLVKPIQERELCEKKIKVLNKLFSFKKELKKKRVFYEKVKKEIVTIKILFQLKDKNFIETVLMKFNYGWSVCVSTQVGCNMGCKFCASGLNKKKRNLETNEIVLQVLITNIFLKKKFNEEIKNIVVMGIGEPFDNYENLNHFLNIAKSHYCINIGETHITVSTCGLVEKIIKFAYDQPKINLAISLHAPCDIIRKKIMPIDKIYNFSALIKGIEKYQEINKKPITIEYLLLKGINDKKENAEELIKNLSNIQYYVNLIPYNKNKEFLFERSDNISEFSKIIKDFGIKTTIRLERGKMINASCGQLRNNYEFKI